MLRGNEAVNVAQKEHNMADYYAQISGKTHEMHDRLTKILSAMQGAIPTNGEKDRPTPSGALGTLSLLSDKASENIYIVNQIERVLGV